MRWLYYKEFSETVNIECS